MTEHEKSLLAEQRRALAYVTSQIHSAGSEYQTQIGVYLSSLRRIQEQIDTLLAASETEKTDVTETAQS